MQVFHDKHRAGFPLERYERFALLYSLKGQLGHADPHAANSLDNEMQPFIAFVLCRIHQPQILRLGQFLFLGAVDLPLKLDGFHPAFRPAEKGKQTVNARQHGIDTANRVVIGN